jgi:hypothetical protein
MEDYRYKDSLNLREMRSAMYSIVCWRKARRRILLDQEGVTGQSFAPWAAVEGESALACAVRSRPACLVRRSRGWVN